jgi:hypothetical protein
MFSLGQDTRTSFVFSLDPSLWRGVLSLHPEGCDLLGDETEHENDDGTSPHKNRHIREPAVGQIGVKVVPHTHREKEKTYGEKYAERRKERGDLRNNQ